MFEFEIVGFDKNNKKVIIHIREEKTLKLSKDFFDIVVLKLKKKKVV